MSVTESSMAEAIQWGEESPNPTIRQYARNFRRVMAFHGRSESDFAREAASLDRYLAIAPKYRKTTTWLVERLKAQGLAAKTYKQYQPDGRRLIESYTGALQARLAIRAMEDDFTVLTRRAEMLAEAGLLEKKEQLRGLAAIRDTSRALGLQPQDLSRDAAIALHDICPLAAQWESVKRGAALLDKLRVYPSLRSMLPIEPIGDLSRLFRDPDHIPEGLDCEIQGWVEVATTVIPEDLETQEARDAFTETHSEGSIGVYLAAVRRYVRTVPSFRILAMDDRLGDLFDDRTIEGVLVRWIESSRNGSGLTARTLFQYTDKLRLTLERCNLPKAAAKLKKLLKSLPILLEGKAASQIMSPDTEDWCRDLLASDHKRFLFEMQHVLYAEKASEAIIAARAAGLELVELSEAEAMKKLPDERRRLAKRLLRRARMFGACAAFAAIELEAAPFRKSNTLGLLMSGAKQTFFDHRRHVPRCFTVLVPNELLKNGKELTDRNQSIPPLLMREGLEGSYAFDILCFFLKEIRPLFPGGATSAALFAPLKAGARHLPSGTFDEWLFECSTEIGLPLTPHRFRHGVCSIEINDDLSGIKRVAMLMGDKPETVARYYAFIQRGDILRQLQVDRAKRRAGYGHILQIGAAA